MRLLYSSALYNISKTGFRFTQNNIIVYHQVYFNANLDENVIFSIWCTLVAHLEECVPHAES